MLDNTPFTPFMVKLRYKLSCSFFELFIKCHRSPLLDARVVTQRLQPK